MTDVIKSLSGVGFTIEEAGVYKAALMLGRASVTDLARKSELKRTSVYHYIENLLKYELLSREIQGKRMVYVAQNPEKILKKLNNQRKKLEETLPGLVDLYTSVRKKPRIQFLENKQEIRNAYLEFSDQLSSMRAIISVQDFKTAFSFKEIATFNKNLSDNGTRVYDLVEDNPEGRAYMKSFKIKSHQVRFMPKGFAFTTDTLVTNNTVFIVSFKNMMGIVIENEDIANFFRSTHKLVWDIVGS